MEEWERTEARDRRSEVRMKPGKAILESGFLMRHESQKGERPGEGFSAKA